MLDISSLFSEALQQLNKRTDNDIAEDLLPALAISLEKVDDLFGYTLFEKESVLLQSQREALSKHGEKHEASPLKQQSKQTYQIAQGSLSAHYVFCTQKPAPEIKRFANTIFLILRLHQHYSQIKKQVQQEQQQTREALQDIRQTQQELIEAEKIGALGGLLAGMAHELNTPLGISITALSTLQEEITRLQQKVKEGTLSRREMENTLQNMQDAGQLLETHLNSTVLRIQDFKRVSPHQTYEKPQPINLKAHIHQIINVLQHTPKYQHITFQVNIKAPLLLYTYPNVWTQIINEWVSNSFLHGFTPADSPTIRLQLTPFQAEPQQGIQALLNLMDHRLESEEGQGTPRSDVLPSQPLWRLTYTDNGSGIEAAIKPIVFEPFSTRSKSLFSGLGLYMVYNLVHQKLDGEIHLTTSPEPTGSRFEIIFPQTNAPETKPL